jgi:hypothetical protein
MLYPLKFKIEFDGNTVSEIRLPDFIKSKHNLAYARVAKLAKELKFDEVNVEELSDDQMIEYFAFEAESQQILIEAFAEGLPKGAAVELSAIDCECIAEEIQKVTNAHTELMNKKRGVAPVQSGKKQARKLRSGR